MNIRTQVMGGVVCTCLFGIISAAHAEKWVDTKHEILVDVDSIRKDADGLVYFSRKGKTYDDNENRVWDKPAKAAYDCEKGVEFYSITKADWKSNGVKVKPNTMGSELLEFVCSRVPKKTP